MSRLEDALNKAYQVGTETTNSLPPFRPFSTTPEGEGSSYLNSINTNIQLTLADVERPLVAFTSALPKEGVSTILYHLSRAIAREKKTLVVDFNILSPRLHKLFQVDNIKGLSDILQGRKRIEECVSETDTPDLDLLPCGPTGASTFQILGSGVVRRIFSDLRSTYETILVDCPCLRNFPDSAVLGSLCDGVIMVVRSGKTKREILQYSQELLEKAGARELGVILNRVRFHIPEFIYRRL